jgi:hypothetical protein
MTGDLDADERFERALFWRELAILVVIAAVVAAVAVLA